MTAAAPPQLAPDIAAGLRRLKLAAMRQLAPGSTELAYRDQMAAIARRHLPGRVGVNVDGFAGRYLS